MTRPGSSQVRLWSAALLVVLLLAFGLRTYQLEAQSLWSDEGLSLYRAGQPPAELLRGVITVDGVETRDTNPPFYFLLLHAWQSAGGVGQVAGAGVFYLRYLSVLAGLLAVPLLYLLGRRAFGWGVGLAAALLLAISPFHVWMSQELRNYSLLVLLNLFSVYGLYRFMLARPDGEPGARRGRWLALWAAAGLLGVYTHYFGFFVLAYGGLSLLLALGWRRWRPPRWLLALAGLAALALLPALPIALERFRAGQQVDFALLPPWVVLRQALAAFAVGISPSLEHPAGRMLPALAAFAAGLGLAIWRRRWAALWLTAGYLAVPLAILLLLSQVNPLYNGPRHVLIALPPFLLLAAVGVADWPGRGRWLGWALGLLLLLNQAQWLYVQFHDPALAKDDVRGAAEFLNRHATADDLIVLHDTLIRFTFEHYYHGAAPVVTIPPLWQQDTAAATAALAEAGSQAARLWFLAQPTPRTGFPRELLWEWADANWPRFATLDFAGLWLRVHLNGYTPDPAVAGLPATAGPLDLAYGAALTVQGVTLPNPLPAGATSWPVFYVQRGADPRPGNYTFSLRLVDEAGQVWAQADELLWRRFPPADWPADTLLRYDHELRLPAGVPPGEYQLWLRLLDEDLQPVALVAGGVDGLLGRVQVTASRAPQALAELPPHTAQNSRFGPATLLGYGLPPSGEARPGHVLPLDLYWQVRQPPAEDFLVRAQLLDSADNVVSEAVGPPTRSDYPPRQWQPDELLHGRLDLVVPGTVAPGVHRLRLQRLDPAGQPLGRPVTLAETLSVVAWPLVTELPPIANPLRADFGQPSLIELHGYELVGLPRPGETLALTLHWRAAGPAIPLNYHVFVHLLDAADNIVAQGDGPPLYGARPTAGWRPGEVLADEHLLLLPADLPPGEYTILLGFYDPDTFARLPATIAGQPQPDDAVACCRLPVTGD